MDPSDQPDFDDEWWDQHSSRAKQKLRIIGVA